MRWLLCLVAACAAAAAQTTAAGLLERKLAASIRQLDEKLDGTLGVAVVDLATGEVFAYNGSVTFPQASSIKIPIMMEVYRAARAGALRLDDSVTLTTKDLVGGSGRLQDHLNKGPITLTVRDLMRAMIEHSDNLATNRLIDMVGMKNVNVTLDHLGFRATRLQRRMMDSAAAERDDENISTPIEMARIAELIYRGRAVDEEASHDMISLMKLVKADFRKAVPASIEVASKPGDVPGVHCETGILYIPGRPVVLSVMSTYLRGESNPIADAAALVYSHYARLGASNRYGHRLK